MTYLDQDEDAIGNAKKLVQSLKPKLIKWGAAAAALLALNASWFTVSPSDRANVRRLGSVVYSTPLKQGFHLKIPVVDTVDTLQVSQNTHEIGDLEVGTIDNQRVTLKINYIFDLPEGSVNRLLYNTGAAGSDGIQDQVAKTVRAAAVSVFSSENMNTVNANLEPIRVKLQNKVTQQLSSLYDIDVKQMQIEDIKPSPAFLASNEAAVKAKNGAIAAENLLKQKEFEAQQVVATAKGNADAAIQHARGESESTLLISTAEEKKLELLGKGEQSRLTAEITAVGGADKYIEYLKAQAALKWNGDVPAVMSGNGAGSNLIVPLPPSVLIPKGATAKAVP